MVDQLEKDARFWDRIARKYAADTISDIDGYENTLSAVDHCLSGDQDVLEIGCGTGTTAMRLAGQTARYLATDISPEMVAIAREKNETASISNLTFEVGEPVTAEWQDNAYDVVLAFNVLHLVPSAAQTLDAVHRRLKPGGLFISKTPCLAMMNPLIRAVIPVMQLFGKAPSVTSFTPDALETLIEAANFEVIEWGWHGTKGKDTRPYFVARKL
jgi:ubiquinone/menaquinone biosynthesis C-methylase UbiE